ncbi:unnamed protein product [Didymodactylos carnosus]|uniref:Uncharacterized protein n=1 Tax=Didymodactylos carnosus TaxID=1234261 RepID=A0A814ZDK1_9BILA|nr:unnamed protein product [Didymodactylos carnosus]CAF1240283.1 unnamed protein product [Didymodactylos carnosus]CAF3756326.1 unnamed protein product [Didymodactylos carnosus]CAF4002639.1 unnamed protein product [Didymodactylos carnosus]
MVSEGKEHAIQHLSKAQLAFIGVLKDVKGGIAMRSMPPINHYTVTFENIKRLRGNISNTIVKYQYQQSGKGLKMKTENENEDQARQAAEDDEVKEPKEGDTYLAILKDEENIEILVEINPNDINEIIQSAPEPQAVL